MTWNFQNDTKFNKIWPLFTNYAWHYKEEFIDKCKKKLALFFILLFIFPVVCFVNASEEKECSKSSTANFKCENKKRTSGLKEYQTRFFFLFLELRKTNYLIKKRVVIYSTNTCVINYQREKNKGRHYKFYIRSQKFFVPGHLNFMRNKRFVSFLRQLFSEIECKCNVVSLRHADLRDADLRDRFGIGKSFTS